MAGGAMAALTAAAYAQGEDAPSRDEIVVTAQKRSQTLLEVPQSVAVIDDDELQRMQAVSIADFQRLAPGLYSQQQNPGQSMLVVRGITTNSANPTVSVYIDETPFGASTGNANAATISGDFDTFDIERIEVLRGPQGTLYGASSLGGVVRYITTPPKLGEYEAKVQVGGAAVKGGDANWSGNAAINIPLGDDLAFRASGGYRKWGGFIDAPSRNAADVNDAESYGGRASLLFEPTERLTIRVSGLLQNMRTESRGDYDADPATFAPLKADPLSMMPIEGLNRVEFRPDKTDIDYRLITGTIDLDLDFATLTSVTSYGKLTQDDNSDASFIPAGPGVYLADVVTGLYGSAEPLGVNFSNQLTLKKFTQELRLASPDNDTLEWVIGGYYTREPGLIFQRYLPFVSSSGEFIPTPVFGFDDLVLAVLDSTYKEYAGFASATWYVAPRFDITAGGRYSHNHQDTFTILDGVLFGFREETVGESSENVFTWNVSPRFELNDQAAIYARIAKGFRPGGPNPQPPGAGPDFPKTFDSDTLISYELGLRGETLDGVFAWDASVYYLDWSNIQIGVVVDSAAGPVNVDGNGQGAKVIGAEAALALYPIEGLVLAAKASYNDSDLDGDLNAAGDALDGEALPISPKWAANLDVNYEWALSSSANAFIGGNLNYVGDRVARYDGGYRATFGFNPVLDSYTTLDLRAGVDFGNYSISIYGKNMTDELGLNNVNVFGDRPGGAISVYPIRPRTIGAVLEASF